MEIIIATYIIGVITILLSGIFLMLVNCENGRKDKDFITGKMLFKFCLIFPYVIYKFIKTKLDEAENNRYL